MRSFALMFNTGARVQEVLNLRRRDVRLDAPSQVRLHGKGNKMRLCPLWPVDRPADTGFDRRDGIADPEPADTFIFANARAVR